MTSRLVVTLQDRDREALERVMKEQGFLGLASAVRWSIRRAAGVGASVMPGEGGGFEVPGPADPREVMGSLEAIDELLKEGVPERELDRSESQEWRPGRRKG